MIHLYALSYLLEKYNIKSLDSIVKNASEPVCITVIDNKSTASPKIFTHVKKLIDQGKIKRYIQLTDNVQIMAFNQAYQLFPPDNSEEFFMLTELDLLVQNVDWVKETRLMMKQPRVNITGFRLDPSNYKPPNGGHVDDGVSCGFWLMGLNTAQFNRIYPVDKMALEDNRVRNAMSIMGGIPKQCPKTVYHMTWDAHKDYPAYFKLKADGIHWNFDSKSKVEFIYEK